MKQFSLLILFITMLAFNCHITVGQNTFKGVTDLEIRSSRTSLSDQCIIKLPNLQKQFEKSFKVGDPVTVNIGYDSELNTEFEGFISKKKAGRPFEIVCEDYMFTLKRKPINRAWRSVSLKTLLQEITQGVDLTISSDLPDVELSPFRIENSTAAKALQKLKDEFGLTVYFRGKSLYAGLAYSENLEGKNTYNLSLGLPLQGTNLEFKDDDDTSIKLTAISVLSDNTKLTVEVGDPDGEQRTWHTYNVSNESDLKVLATEKLRDFKYSGYEGFIKTFGRPYPKHGQVAEVKDSVYPDREGSYVIDEVISRVSKTDGFKRKVRLGIQV